MGEVTFSLEVRLPDNIDMPTLLDRLDRNQPLDAQQRLALGVDVKGDVYVKKVVWTRASDGDGSRYAILRVRRLA